MRLRRNLLATILVPGVLALALPVAAAEAAPVAGYWTGKLLVPQGEIDLTIELDAAPRLVRIDPVADWDSIGASIEAQRAAWVKWEARH